ncbi:MAG: NAD(P)-binding domain-containing protein [Nanoarchaeota archaeon]|nr:NAD(P)-binding domain-containing protein [Nanoarchaeota archaeon]
MKHKIAFIGSGTMGSGMINNLVKAGFEVEFYNRTPKKIEGATYKTLEELNSDVYFICVSNDEAVKNCFERINLQPGNIFVDTGTTSLDLTLRLKEQCKIKDVEFLDAPITGSKLGAESGNLLFMVGGNKYVFDELH